MAEPVIHIIDDDEAIRDSLTFLLDTANFKVRAYDSAEAFLARLDGLEPGCIITDLRMPGMSGMDLVQRLKDSGAAIPVIVITGHGDVSLAVEAMKAGVCDFIEKPFDDNAIFAALNLALSRLGDQGRGAARRAVIERLESLSQRERQVLDGLVSGRANKVIAYDLGISPRTVEVYRANVMTKMQAASLSELVRMALLAGDY